MFRHRVKKELDLLLRDPCPGITVWAKETNDVMNLEAHIEGPSDSPYENGLFLISIRVPTGYPMDPPHLQFITPIFHPNIDSDGRICLDTLKPQPQGTWSPASSLHTVLLSVRLLIGYPNAADGLSPAATELYKRDIMKFKAVAAEHTQTHAMKPNCGNNMIVSDNTSNIASASDRNGANINDAVSFSGGQTVVSPTSKLNTVTGPVVSVVPAENLLIDPQQETSREVAQTETETIISEGSTEDAEEESAQVAQEPVEMAVTVAVVGSKRPAFSDNNKEDSQQPLPQQQPEQQQQHMEACIDAYPARGGVRLVVRRGGAVYKTRRLQ